MMDAVWRDLRFAVRGLGRSPAFTAIAVLTLALGIGANTAIFSVVNAVLLRPLSYTQPEQLVSLRARLTGRGRNDVPMSQPEYHDLVREVPRAPRDRGRLAHQHQPHRPGRARADPGGGREQQLLLAARRGAGGGARLRQGGRRRTDRLRRPHLLRSVAAPLRRRPRGRRQERAAGRRPDHHHRRHAARVPPPGGERRVADGALGAHRAGQSRHHVREHPGGPGVRPDRSPGSRRHAGPAACPAAGARPAGWPAGTPTPIRPRSAGRRRPCRWRSGWWATCGRRCWCCWARWGSCSSSAAPTSPTCCWLAPPPGTARSPSAPLSAAAAPGSSGSCSPRAWCWRAWAGCSACSSRPGAPAPWGISRRCTSRAPARSGSTVRCSASRRSSSCSPVSASGCCRRSRPRGRTSRACSRMPAGGPARAPPAPACAARWWWSRWRSPWCCWPARGCCSGAFSG